MKKKVKIAVISAGIFIILFFALEIASISDWNAKTVFGKRIGTIEYRPMWGEFNRFTMGMNEIIMGVFGYSFEGLPEFRGTFDKWMHTYSKDVG